MTKDLRVDHLVSRLLAGAALGLLAWSPASFAQSAPVVARPVVQALPSADSKRLATALATLGRNPRDVAALIEAGDAARALQDFDAAIGFYHRADEASPGNARVKAGLGSAFALSGDPVSAIPQFEAAEKAGATPALISGDRGLAYDLVGDNAAAQRYYAQALATTAGAQADELRTRLAVSQAIGGQGDAAYATLLPLLNKRDKPGWRTRAFTLAIAGDTTEAVDVAQKILPAPLASNIAPYLRYMPRLTRAQQAAAANLGRFPRASEVGRDDARIAAYAPPSTAAAGSGLIPKGEPLGGTRVAKAGTTKADRAKASRATKTAADRTRTAAGAPGSTTARSVILAAADPDRVAPPEVKPTIERDSAELPPVGSRVELPSVIEEPRSSVPVPASASMPSPAPTSTPSPTQAAQTPSPAPAKTAGPGFDLARVTNPAPSATSTSASRPAPAAPAAIVLPAAASSPTPPAPGPGQLSLSEIFADLGKPTIDAVPASGAVDIRKITPAPPPPRVAPKVEEPKVAEVAPADAKGKDPKGKAVDPKATDPKAKGADPKAKDAKTKAAEAKAAADAKAKAKKPAPPSHPSRIWVQIGVGRDKDAIAFDWRRYNREAPALFKGRQPYISDMGRTNRILVGPFATQKAATTFLADAKKQGFSGALPWTSPAGQVVDTLSAK
ncbi:SPOR domain-containing protein [Novosphingobium sp. AP12]|uniref:SPOR domain-containing protein n=1 Tax=Novosphingobium sp. AP12 TaxID=1144305 RepID=UPI000271DD59|nr:SPOR domain-containing protein [Novosphingobium sp. AP12]EJL29466.1 sporulation related protein [Novosphingobium sp. AP12]